MARAYPQSQPIDSGADWQTLRGELASLLDQVETQVARTHPAPPAAGPDRHRDALMSVQRAVDRFSVRDEGETLAPRAGLQSAIDQIRARQSVPVPRAVPAPAPRADEYAGVLNGMSARLERIEGVIKSSAGSGADIKAVGDQVAQLAHVVELLAGAVGETGQVKRIEGQIASLGKMIAQNQQTGAAGLTEKLEAQISNIARLVAQNQSVDVAALTARLEAQLAAIGKMVVQSHESDVPALTGRMDDMSSAVGRLADLQVQFANKADNPAHVAAFRDGMELIESSVRAIYDRIDALEHNGGLSQGDIDRLTGEMSQFIEAMKNPAAPQGLVELIDALNVRISELESGDRILGPLRKDLIALRDAVTVSLEPRFDALERKLDSLVPSVTDFSGINQQLEELNARIAERPIDNGIGQLEAQVRQLVARMDQTGEQLSGLAKLYASNDPPPAPDFDQLADLVATRTSAALREVESAPGISQLALDGLEERIAALIQTLSPGATPASEAPSREETDRRLAALEASLLERRFVMPEDEAEPEAETLSYFAERNIEPEVDLARMEDDLAEHVVSDSMPKGPAEDAPLIAQPFPEPSAVSNSLTGQRRHHPGLDDEISLASRHDEPEPEPIPAQSMSLPPMPQPSAGFFDAPASSSDSVAEAAPVATSSRNTFIEAHRRAAQKAQPAAVPAAASNSLIGRALARFQAANNGDFKKSEPEPARVLPGDKPARTEWKAEPAPKVEPMAAAATAEPDAAEMQIAASEHDEAKESFLSRNRRVILLGAAVVALAFLTYNLMMQRMATTAAPTPDAVTTGSIDSQSLPLAPTPVETSVPDTVAPRVIPMVDSLSTGSTSPVAVQGFAASKQQALPAAFEAATAMATENSIVEPRVANLPGAVKVEMPPDGVGPLELREAASNGDARAQFEIAAIYTEGRAVPQDYKQAAVWYERSAAQGFAPSQYRLGTLYENGDGLTKDIESARLWYERAAEAGNRMSMHNLAAIYAGGGLGKQQFDSAAKWFEEAATRGLTDSQFNLGMLYARGLGVKQSLADSYKWFSIAALSGDKDAAKARDDVARSLGAEEVARLTAEVEAFKPAPIDLAANFAPIGTWSKTFDPGETISAKDIVASVQAALTRLGYDVGVPDGVTGPKTSDAIKSFERATGMSEVGRINPRLLAVLGSQPV